MAQRGKRRRRARTPLQEEKPLARCPLTRSAARAGAMLQVLQHLQHRELEWSHVAGRNVGARAGGPRRAEVTLSEAAAGRSRLGRTARRERRGCRSGPDTQEGRASR